MSDRPSELRRPASGTLVILPSYYRLSYIIVAMVKKFLSRLQFFISILALVVRKWECILVLDVHFRS